MGLYSRYLLPKIIHLACGMEPQVRQREKVVPHAWGRELLGKGHSAMSRLLPLVFAGLAATSCNWISLAKNALTYREIQRGQPGNLAVHDTLIYATLAEDGLAILGAGSRTTLARLAPPVGSESVDDLVVADGLLFVLDARAPGHVSVYSLDDPLHPLLVTSPRDAPVEPFSGVSAGGGLCVVSGGTSSLTAWRYDSLGALSAVVATTDLGRGQPDALVAADGETVYVSTHFWGPYFGLDLVRYDPASHGLEMLAEVQIDGAGFTAGGAKPANFPIVAAELSRDTVLVAFARGVAVITTARPARLEAVLDMGGPAVSLAVRDAVAAVAVSGPDPAVVLVDFAGTPAPVARRIPLPPGTLPSAVALTAASVAVAAGDQGILVLDRDSN